MSDIRERFWTWWFDGMIPQPVADRLFDRVVSEAARDQLGALVDKCRELTEREMQAAGLITDHSVGHEPGETCEHCEETA